MRVRYLVTQGSFLTCLPYTANVAAGIVSYPNCFISLDDDFEIILKSGRKLYASSIDGSYGVKGPDDATILRKAFSASAWGDFAGHTYILYSKDNGDIYFCRRPIMQRTQSSLRGGLFVNGVSQVYNSTDFIQYDNFVASFGTSTGASKGNVALNFNSTDGSAEVSWHDRLSPTGQDWFYFLYPIVSFNTDEFLLNSYIDSQDISDTEPTSDFAVTTNLTGCIADSTNPTVISPEATSTLFKFSPNSGYYFDINSVTVEGDGYPSGTPILYSWVPSAGTLHVSAVTSDVAITVVAYQEPYSGGGESEPGHGEPTYDVTSVNVPYQESPDLGALNSGFVTLYTPKMSDVQNLARYMWAGSFDINNFKKLFSDPMDAILGFSILPLTSTELGAVHDTIYVGNLPTPVDCDRVTRQYVTINCGNISLRGTWGAYLDYSPYTKLQLYLPYIGFVELNPDDCMNRIISIRYSVDVYSGACLAQVYVSRFEETETEETEIGSVLYEFSGNCASWYPINAGQYQNGIAAIFNAAIGIGTAGLQIAGGIGEMKSGNVAQGISIAASGVKNGVSSLVDNVASMMKPVIQRSGGPGGSSFMMGHQYPYLIITIPRMIIPGKQNEMIGYPSYVTCNLAELNGFTSVESIHIKGIEATREEIDEIYELLKNGVFL